MFSDLNDEASVHFVHILRELPLTASRPMIASYISYLDGRGDGVLALASNRHVSFALEVTGACLTLPLEDVELMSMAVNLLTRWYACICNSASASFRPRDVMS